MNADSITVRVADMPEPVLVDPVLGPLYTGDQAAAVAVASMNGLQRIHFAKTRADRAVLAANLMHILTSGAR